MKRLYKNWFVHNMFAHPLSEIAYWIVRPFGAAKASQVAGAIHDASIPDHVKGEGRG